MDTTKAMILDWERKIREHDTKPLSNSYFSFTPDQNEKQAIALCRYVFEKVLHWTPEDVRNNITGEIIETLMLKKAYGKFIFPRELSSRSDYWYIAKKCYPEKIHDYTAEDIWKMEYLKVLDNRCGKFPKNYFSETNGELRAKIFLLHQLESTVQFEDLEEMYTFFANNQRASKYIADCKLKAPLDTLFASPLEYMHESLPAEQKDEFLLKFVEFTEMDRMRQK